MAALRYRDELNKVGYLQKPTGSDDYHQILDMVDRHDLLKLYGLVVKYYENHHVAGAGLVLWGDLQVLMDSQVGGKGSLVWNHQSHWQIRSWRLYTLSNVHVLETVSGEVLYMFSDVSYPLSVKLMERMLTHKLEIEKDVVGNDMTTAEQLIRFIKHQLAATQSKRYHDRTSTSTNVEDEPLGGSFHASPQGQSSFPAEVHSLETELKATQAAIYGCGGKVREQDVDLELYIGMANAVVTVGFTKFSGVALIPAAEPFMLGLVLQLLLPSHLSEIARKGKGVSVGRTYSNSTYKDFKQLEEQDVSDFKMTEAKKETARVLHLLQGLVAFWSISKEIRKLSPEQLQEEFDKIQRAVAFTRGLKRDGSPMSSASSKKLKTGDVEVDTRDNSRKYFTSLREILHLVTRADLMTIYGRVMTFYQDKKAEGVGLVLWGDLQILMDSPEVNDGISGLVIHMFVDKKYPFTINLNRKMLDHQLRFCHRNSGFMCSRQDSSRLDVAVKFIFQSSRYVVPTGRVVVPTGRYVVPAGKVIIIVSLGRLNLVPTGRILSLGKVK
ncbi:hypothetical protein Tco_0628416 [Tanacetum coccineum]|uniref:Uncharacterized protein n=1 Tax=Tanacetum coccineum TaxID=301880 RepID=A0ABQ4WQ96_9ASTR